MFLFCFCLMERQASPDCKIAEPSKCPNDISVSLSHVVYGMGGGITILRARLVLMMTVKSATQKAIDGAVLAPFS